jgi:hypothetical protein
VLTVPHRLRYLMAWDHRLCRAVLAVYVRVLCGWYRRRGRRRGWADPRTGTVTAIQRFGGGINLHVHYHTLVLDGVFVRDEAGDVVFHPLPPPTDVDVARILGTIARRVTRLLTRRGLLPTGADEDERDVATDLSPSLALMTAGAVQGRESLGPAAGRRIAQLGRDSTRAWQPSTGPRQAHQDGFDLHANVRVGPLDHRGREHLVQYVLRPPLAQQRLQRRRDGHVVLALQRPWRDGTRALVFPPLAVLERLAALTPRPRINLLLYHGVLAPNAAWRAAVVPGAASEAGGDEESDAAQARSAAGRGRHIAWATLLQRVFEVDVLACPRCDGRLELLATIEEPAVVCRILTHVGLPAEPVAPRAPPPTPDAFWEPA